VSPTVPLQRPLTATPATDGAVPARPRLASRLRKAFPTGRTLPEAEFRRRHRALLALLWFHVAALPVYGVLQGKTAGHCLIEGSALALIAVLAQFVFTDRKHAAILVSVGLMTASALVVHLSGGVIEAHFHFFVMVVVLTLYEDWVAFLIAIGYVLLHHGIGGVVDPGSVYSHADAVQHPWRWAFIHAAFVAAAALGAIVAWRLNEDVREQEQHMLARAQEAEAAANRALADLERSNRDLEQFAYVASHDLSEPLRTVASFVGLLQQRYKGQLDDNADEFIHYAVDGTKRMQRLIDDLLSYSRVGRSDHDPQPVDLDAVIEGKLRDLSGLLEASGATVEVSALPIVMGDQGQLSQVFQNLISNAMKFHNGAAPAVRVQAECNGRECTIAVADNGIGIDPGQAERIFKMFQRLHAREAYDGTGIGLSICQRIVERHGGRIWVEPAPAGGSVFKFTLPLAN
jgi:signal transduction histidine kinase